MVTKILDNSYHELWNSMVKDAVSGGYMQSWEWGNLKENQGHRVYRLGLFEDEQSNKLIGGTICYDVQTSMGSAPIVMPHGPMIPWHDRQLAISGWNCLESYLKTVAAETKSPSIRIDPYLPKESIPFIDSLVKAPVDLVPTPTRVISLEGFPEKVFEGMKHKGRYNISVAHRHGVNVRSGKTTADIDSFYDLFSLTAARHNFRCEPKSYIEQLLGGEMAELTTLYIASCKGVDLAAALVIQFGKRATYLYGGSSPFLRYLMAPYALHAAIIKESFEKGYSEYDLFGIAPEDNPNHPYSKFSSFKARFGGNVFTPSGAYDLILEDNFINSFLSTVQHLLM